MPGASSVKREHLAQGKCNVFFSPWRDLNAFRSQNINTALPLSSSIKNLIEREPFFQRAPPKHVLMTPLFVQGRYFGSLVLTGRNPTSSNATSQISLLATYVPSLHTPSSTDHGP